MPEFKPYTMTCHWGPLEDRTRSVYRFDTRAEARAAWKEAIQKARQEKTRLKVKLETPWGVSHHIERADKDPFNGDLETPRRWFVLPALLLAVTFILAWITGSFIIRV